jgi:S1-C subfamily serine protease
MRRLDVKSLLVGLGVGVIVIASALGGALADRIFVIKPLDAIAKRVGTSIGPGLVNTTVYNESNTVIDVAENVSPSVVTVSAQSPRRRVLEFSPFGGLRSTIQGGEPQDIGSGFIVSADGLIVTNKHVVSDTGVSYKVVTKDGKEFDVKEISRDPTNDIAVIKIDAHGLTPVKLGESGNLKVGQFVIAIGTALGEFRHTVTTGVISGLGRGITAGSSFEGFVERLDDVIQTDAAINPGNSGGPLLNANGQVIAVNVAVAQGAQNIGFAIPINVVKNALDQFNKTGKFPTKAYLGVQYELVDKESAILNSVPQGAYVKDVIADSPAEKAGVQVGDIITKLDGADVKSESGGLADLISKKKAGDTVKLDVWRDDKNITINVTLSEFSQ